MNRLISNLTDFYKKYQNISNIFLLAILTLIVFYNSLNNYLIEVDDFSVFLHTPRNIFSVFTTNTFGGSSGYNYRPLEVLSHLFDISVYGDQSIIGRHITNLVMHIFCVVLVYFVGYGLSKKRSIGLIAGLFFSVHIIHSNSLPPTAWITGRIDIIVTFFYLLTLLLFVLFLEKKSKLFYFLSFLTFFLGLLSKEMAATLPLIIVAYLLIFINSEEELIKVDLKRINIELKFLVLAGILIIAAGIIFNPTLMERYLSPDNKFKQGTIEKIHYLQIIAFISGGVIILGTILFFILLRASKWTSNLVQRIRYAIPYFLILLFYLILRFSLIGGLGGGYISESGAAVNLQFGLGSLMRDLYGLVGFIWPVSEYYNIAVFRLQVENPLVFFSISILISIAILFTFLKFIKLKQQLSAFSLLWIFITALPTHNILITPWQYNTKYLYLPLVGFCLLAAFWFNKVLQLKNYNSKILKSITIILISLITIYSSYLIILHNNLIGRSGIIMKQLVSDLQTKYKSRISDESNFYFLVYPFTSISTKSAMFIYPYMQDVLNYSDRYPGFGKKYNYSFLLFSKSNDTEKFQIIWKDNYNFSIEGLDIDKYCFIPKSLSDFDEKIKKIYKRNPPHAILQKLPAVGESVETDDAIIIVTYVDKISKQANLDVKLKKPENVSVRNNLFFLYNNNRLELVREN